MFYANKFRLFHFFIGHFFPLQNFMSYFLAYLYQGYSQMSGPLSAMVLAYLLSQPLWLAPPPPLNRRVHRSKPHCRHQFLHNRQSGYCPALLRQRLSTPHCQSSGAGHPLFAAAASVTPCNIDTSSPISAVSPMTTLVAWSIIMPLPIFAAG